MYRSIRVMMGVMTPAAQPAATTSLPRRRGRLCVFQDVVVGFVFITEVVVGDAIVECIVRKLLLALRHFVPSLWVEGKSSQRMMEI